MTQKSKWTPRARVCLEYQQYVAWCALQAHLPEFEGHIMLTAKIYQKTRGRADLDNLLKSLQDGIQLSNVIDNDRQIVRYGEGTGFYLGHDDEKVVITLEEIKI